MLVWFEVYQHTSPHKAAEVVGNYKSRKEAISFAETLQEGRVWIVRNTRETVEVVREG